MHIAAKHGHLDILKCLLKDMKQDALVAAVNASDQHGLTPLFLTSQRCGTTGVILQVSGQGRCIGNKGCSLAASPPA